MRHLEKSKQNKNDEFYTQYIDIEKELINYKDEFRDKVIWCPCDSRESNFYKYFRDNFDSLGLKKLICSSLTDYTYIKTKEEEKIIEEHIDMEDEDSKYWREVDIVVTNPPFSRIRSYAEILFDNNVKFLLLGCGQWSSYKIFISALVNKKIHLGFNCGTMNFDTPNEKKRMNNINWWTNLDIWPQRDRYNFVPFDKDKYEYLDSYELPVYKGLIIGPVLNVDKSNQIPRYDGLLAVPISFLNKLNYDDFELLDVLNHPKIGDRNVYRRLLLRIKDKD